MATVFTAVTRVVFSAPFKRQSEAIALYNAGQWAVLTTIRTGISTESSDLKLDRPGVCLVSTL